MSENEEQWEVYPSELQGQFAMFAVNLGIAQGAPYANLRWLTIVRMTFEPQPSGMPSNEANKLLYAAEDLLHRDVSDRGGLQVGRVTVSGRREIFLYSATNDAEVFQAALERRFPDLEVESFSREDSDWQVFFDLLYPGPLDFQRIHNQRVVRALTEHGDDPSIARKIDHFAYFPDPAARKSFRDELVERGFAVEYEEEGDKGDLRFGIAFRSHGPVDLSSVDQLTIPLFVRAEQLGGHYDGWGCEVTKG